MLRQFNYLIAITLLLWCVGREIAFKIGGSAGAFFYDTFWR